MKARDPSFSSSCKCSLDTGGRSGAYVTVVSADRNQSRNGNGIMLGGGGKRAAMKRGEWLGEGPTGWLNEFSEGRAI